MTDDDKSLDPSQLKRSKKAGDKEKKPNVSPVSAGAIERVIDYAFNPTAEKIREVTSIDRRQGRLLPRLDVEDTSWQHMFQVASYRQDPEEYERQFGMKYPIPPNLIEVFIYRSAQWQKSVNGTNLKAAIDLALAETEAQGDRADPFDREDAYRD